jgi:hypothetical protein
MKKTWWPLGVVLAACGGGESEPDGMPAPQVMLALAEPRDTPFLTETQTVPLSLVADPSIRTVEVAGALAGLEGGTWKILARVPDHPCDGSAAPTEVLHARGYDEDGRVVASLAIPVIRDSCAPVITVLASSLRDELEMIPTVDRNGHVCLWRAPDQPSLEPHAGPVHAHLYGFAVLSNRACDTPPPRPGWVTANDNGVRVRVRVTDDVAVEPFLQVRISGTPTEISPPVAVVTPGASAREIEAEVLVRETWDTAEALPVTLTLEARDPYHRMTPHEIRWTHDTLPGPVAIFPASVPVEGIDPTTCRLDGDGSIAPCLGPTLVDPALGYTIRNGTRAPVSLQIGSDATVELRADVEVSLYAPGEGMKPAAQIPCAFAASTWWWDGPSPVCFDGQASPQPAPQEQRVPFAARFVISGPPGLLGADRLVLGPFQEAKVGILAHPFTELTSLHGIAALAPFSPPKTFLDIDGRSIFGYYGKTLGNAVARPGGMATYSYVSTQYRYDEVSASVDSAARGERGLIVYTAFAGRPERFTLSSHPMTFSWQAKEPPL